MDGRRRYRQASTPSRAHPAAAILTDYCCSAARTTSPGRPARAAEQASAGLPSRSSAARRRAVRRATASLLARGGAVPRRGGGGHKPGAVRTPTSATWQFTRPRWTARYPAWTGRCPRRSEAPGLSRIVCAGRPTTPIVLLHAQALLKSTPQGACDYIQADLRDPDAILAGAARTLDFARQPNRADTSLMDCCSAIRVQRLSHYPPDDGGLAGRAGSPALVAALLIERLTLALYAAHPAPTTSTRTRRRVDRRYNGRVRRPGGHTPGLKPGTTPVLRPSWTYRGRTASVVARWPAGRP